MGSQVTPLTFMAQKATRVVGSLLTPNWRAQTVTDQTPQTLSVPQAGKRYFGLSRNASYAAAQRGQLPIIRIGRLLRVPVRAIERMLDQASDKPAAR
jgi:hypothetical protein